MVLLIAISVMILAICVLYDFHYNYAMVITRMILESFYLSLHLNSICAPLQILHNDIPSLESLKIRRGILGNILKLLNVNHMCSFIFHFQVSSILRKKHDSLTPEERRILEENSELVEQFYKR